MTVSIEDRVAIRRWAEECWEAAEDQQVFAQRILELAGLAPHQRPKPPSVEPMTDDEVKAFGAKPLLVGAHKGKPVNTMRLSYLCKLADPWPELDEFIRDLRRYLRNRHVRLAIELEDG